MHIGSTTDGGGSFFSSLTWIFFLPTDIGSLTFEPILPFLSSSNWLYKEFTKIPPSNENFYDDERLGGSCDMTPGG